MFHKIDHSRFEHVRCNHENLRRPSRTPLAEATTRPMRESSTGCGLLLEVEGSSHRKPWGTTRRSSVKHWRGTFRRSRARGRSRRWTWGPSLSPDPLQTTKAPDISCRQSRLRKTRHWEAWGTQPSPSLSCHPLSQTLGETVRELIDTGVSKFPHLKNTADDIINGREEVRPLDPDAMAKLDNAMMVLFQPEGLPPKTVEAHTPIKAAILQGWAEHTEDPDAETLAKWLQQGAPLGFDEPIERTGVFPTCPDIPIHRAEEMELLKDVDSWQNWPSATEEAEDLQKLIREAQLKGFCRVLEDNDENRKLLEGPQVLNKLGVVVKFQGPDNKKKSRIIWDMRESGVNQRCDPSERILLPRLMGRRSRCFGPDESRQDSNLGGSGYCWCVS